MFLGVGPRCMIAYRYKIPSHSEFLTPWSDSEQSQMNYSVLGLSGEKNIHFTMKIELWFYYHKEEISYIQSCKQQTCYNRGKLTSTCVQDVHVLLRYAKDLTGYGKQESRGKAQQNAAIENRDFQCGLCMVIKLFSPD